jgi:hypothetical protein
MTMRLARLNGMECDSFKLPFVKIRFPRDLSGTNNVKVL